MRKHHISLYIVATLLGLITINNNVSALSYSTDVNIGFTFNPTISLSISPDNLTIPNLTPGTAAESNTITVNVATNTAYGYHLTANVGSNTTNYNTTNLVHASSATSTPTSNATFASLAYGSSVANKDNLSPNTWGYSYSDDSGTTWKPYSGLPLYSDANHSTNLISTYTAADSKSIEFKIAAKANNTQPSGDYTNIINFYATSVPEPPLLYDLVEDMTKGTLAENNVKLSDEITQANSGVYTYDPTVYGTASDASNDYDIYFYRGILDTDAGLGTYGSDGQADAWPNYVKLNNGTCWRIVRTTGSGGTKMIYNGTWSGSTCANATNDTQIIERGITDTYFEYQQIVRVGYTYDSDYAIDENISFPIGSVLGSNSNYLANDTDSPVKNYIENTWFTSIMNSYKSRLEPSAGYCNDRTIYSGSFPYVQQPEDTEIAIYGTSDMTRYSFGSIVRIFYYNGTRVPTLHCVRDKVDLYTTASANNGNKQLLKPIALLTADEVVLAGNGYSPASSSSNANSYLNPGDGFWLLSPAYRSSDGSVDYFFLHRGGYITPGLINSLNGVRPVISLMHHIQVTSGSGAATSPWTIE